MSVKHGDHGLVHSQVAPKKNLPAFADSDLHPHPFLLRVGRQMQRSLY